MLKRAIFFHIMLGLAYHITLKPTNKEITPIDTHIQATDPSTAVIIDTTNRDQYIIQPFIDILTSTGWNVTYRPLDDIMDMNATDLNISSYKAAFFILGIEFLKGIGRSPVATKIMDHMHQYGQLPGKLVGFIFPPLSVSPNTNIIGGLSPLFNHLGITVTQQKFLPFPTPSPQSELSEIDTLHKNIDIFTYVANFLLTRPLETRPLNYETTLNPARPGPSLQTKELEPLLQEKDVHLYMLPLHQTFSPLVQATFPYGLYWFNPVVNNHVFLSYNSIISFSSISENFHVCPIDHSIRQEMNQAIQQMMWEVRLLVKELDQKKNIPKPHDTKRPDTITLPWSISQQGKILSYMPISLPTHKIAWMETTIFEENNNPEKSFREHKKQQRALINYIFDAGLDTLWLSVTPNVYFSPIARHKKNTERFLQGLSNFTHHLTKAAKTRKKNIPKILIGFEITNNIYEPNLPLPCSVDLYGNSYEDIPSSLHRSFWHNEVITPLKTFLQTWKNPSISHEIPISGIVLDLEMYGRKTVGEFSSCMGFDRLSYERFMKHRKTPCKPIPVHEKTKQFMLNKQSKQYFAFLESDAQRLGQEIKKEVTSLIPHAILACYLPNISINWFYKGLYHGLGSSENPLQLYTFNAEFQGHKEWLEANNVFVHHASVLMLSKIKEKKDFSLIDSILQHHHGIWLNRFSRMIEPKINDWGAIERPLIDEAYYQFFCQHLRTTL